MTAYPLERRPLDRLEHEHEPGAVDHNGLEVLGRRDCLSLLATNGLGRISVSMRALPVILPIAYRLVGDDIVFRTGAGARLAACSHNAVVAFETDAVDQRHGTAWSVCVTGMAYEIRRPEELMLVRDLTFDTVTAGPLDHFVRIRSDIVTGRRTRSLFETQTGPKSLIVPTDGPADRMR